MTDAERRVMDALADAVSATGQMPTSAELGSRLGISRSLVSLRIRALAAKGRITTVPDRSGRRVQCFHARADAVVEWADDGPSVVVSDNDIRPVVMEAIDVLVAHDHDVTPESIRIQMAMSSGLRVLARRVWAELVEMEHGGIVERIGRKRGSRWVLTTKVQ